MTSSACAALEQKNTPSPLDMASRFSTQGRESSIRAASSCGKLWRDSSEFEKDLVNDASCAGPCTDHALAEKSSRRLQGVTGFKAIAAACGGVPLGIPRQIVCCGTAVAASRELSKAELHLQMGRGGFDAGDCASL